MIFYTNVLHGTVNSVLVKRPLSVPLVCKRNRLQKQIGCFNHMQSGYPGCRQAKETVIMYYHLTISILQLVTTEHLWLHLLVHNNNHDLADRVTT